MPNLRTSAILCGGAFVLLIATAVVGNLMPEAIRSAPAIRLGLRIVFFGLLAVFTLSMIPLMVNAVFDAQPALRTSKGPRVVIVWILWGIMGLGALVAIPAAFLFGAFGDFQGAVQKRILAHSDGMLVAGIGMTVPEIRRASSVQLPNDAEKYEVVSNGGGVFDYQIPGTPTIFRQCRLYYLTVDSTKHVKTVHISIVPLKMSVPELEKFLTKTRARLHGEGWKQLSSQNDFAHGDTWLELGRARVDDYQSGEAEDAGEWIATIDLEALRAYKS